MLFSDRLEKHYVEAAASDFRGVISLARYAKFFDTYSQLKNDVEYLKDGIRLTKETAKVLDQRTKQYKAKKVGDKNFADAKKLLTDTVAQLIKEIASEEAIKKGMKEPKIGLRIEGKIMNKAVGHDAAQMFIVVRSGKKSHRITLDDLKAKNGYGAVKRARLPHGHDWVTLLSEDDSPFYDRTWVNAFVFDALAKQMLSQVAQINRASLSNSLRAALFDLIHYKV